MYMLYSKSIPLIICFVMKTPMSTVDKLHKDKHGKHVCQTTYRGMIGSSLYLTASRPDIMFTTCLCANINLILRNLILGQSRGFLGTSKILLI